MVVMETPRLIFGRLVAGDLDDLCRLYADADVRRYFPGGTLDRARTRDELDWFLAGGDPDRPEFSLWATIHKPTDRFIGRSGFVPWTIENSPEIEIAYLLDHSEVELAVVLPHRVEDVTKSAAERAKSLPVVNAHAMPAELPPPSRPVGSCLE